MIRLFAPCALDQLVFARMIFQLLAESFLDSTSYEVAFHCYNDPNHVQEVYRRHKGFKWHVSCDAKFSDTSIVKFLVYHIVLGLLERIDASWLEGRREEFAYFFTVFLMHHPDGIFYLMEGVPSGGFLTIIINTILYAASVRYAANRHGVVVENMQTGDDSLFSSDREDFHKLYDDCCHELGLFHKEYHVSNSFFGHEFCGATYEPVTYRGLRFIARRALTEKVWGSLAWTRTSDVEEASKVQSLLFLYAWNEEVFPKLMAFREFLIRGGSLFNFATGTYYKQFHLPQPIRPESCESAEFRQWSRRFIFATAWEPFKNSPLWNIPRRIVPQSSLSQNNFSFLMPLTAKQRKALANAPKKAKRKLKASFQSQTAMAASYSRPLKRSKRPANQMAQAASVPPVYDSKIASYIRMLISPSSVIIGEPTDGLRLADIRVDKDRLGFTSSASGKHNFALIYEPHSNTLSTWHQRVGTDDSLWCTALYDLSDADHLDLAEHADWCLAGFSMKAASSTLASGSQQVSGYPFAFQASSLDSFKVFTTYRTISKSGVKGGVNIGNGPNTVASMFLLPRGASFTPKPIHTDDQDVPNPVRKIARGASSSSSSTPFGPQGGITCPASSTTALADFETCEAGTNFFYSLSIDNATEDASIGKYVLKAKYTGGVQVQCHAESTDTAWTLCVYVVRESTSAGTRTVQAYEFVGQGSTIGIGDLNATDEEEGLIVGVYLAARTTGKLPGAELSSNSNIAVVLEGGQDAGTDVMVCGWLGADADQQIDLSYEIQVSAKPGAQRENEPRPDPLPLRIQDIEPALDYIAAMRDGSGPDIFGEPAHASSSFFRKGLRAGDQALQRVDSVVGLLRRRYPEIRRALQGA
jgi:hypothetical protein